MRLRFLDRFRDPGRRRRARATAAAFGDPAFRAAAERVYFVIERVWGLPPGRVDLDAALGSIAQRAATDPWWDELGGTVGLGDARRRHALENLRNGTVRHLIQHLCLCPTCRSDSPGETGECA